jgi:hypothetical protein
LKDLMTAINNQPGAHRVGIFSNKFMWAKYMGPTLCQDLTQFGAEEVPIWYQHDDKLPNYYDFTPFGQWSKAEITTIKQYKIDSGPDYITGGSNVNFK